MYYYIVDANKLNQREFERVQSQLYSSISEYHISGEIVRVTGIRTIQQLVETAFFHQAKTIVAIGNDETLNEVINVIGMREITVGYIPLAQTEMSDALGLPDIPQACKFLAVRRIQELDLGIINDPPRVRSSNTETRAETGKSFLSKLSFGRTFNKSGGFDFFGLRLTNELSKQEPFEIQFKVDNTYQGSSKIWAGLIVNASNKNSTKQIGNPMDGKLDLLLLPKLNRSLLLLHRKNIVNGNFEDIPNTALIHFKQLEITTPTGLGLNIGETELTQTPVKISIKPKALKIIVGKNRNF